MSNFENNYSAGIVHKLFWMTEAKKTAQIMVGNTSKADVKRIVFERNVYQSPNDRRTTEIFGGVYSRLSKLPEFMIEMLATSDSDTARVINNFALLYSERFFFEFMYDVYRNKIRIGDLIMRDKDFTNFYAEKSIQSEDVASWSEATQDKMRQTMYKMMAEGGLLMKENNQYHITPPLINIEIEDYLKQNGLKKYLSAMTGED